MSAGSNNREHRVRELAYSLWEQDGRPEGQPDHYWSLASAQLDTATDSAVAVVPSDVAPAVPDAPPLPKSDPAPVKKPAKAASTGSSSAKRGGRGKKA